MDQSVRDEIKACLTRMEEIALKIGKPLETILKDIHEEKKRYTKGQIITFKTPESGRSILAGRQAEVANDTNEHSTTLEVHLLHPRTGIPQQSMIRIDLYERG